MKKIVSITITILVLIASLIGCQSDDIINYSLQENWAYIPAKIQKDVDLFIICPTVDMGSDNRFNLNLDNKKIKTSFVGALTMETGIYDQACDVYAPFYRQMTLTAYGNEHEETYRNKAYQDVKSSFIYYFEHYNKGRPFILAGFSQGAQMGLMLMQDLFDDPKYSKLLVASYLIGWRVTEDAISDAPWIKMASGESDIGCVISFNSEAPKVSTSFVVPEGTKTLAINPLNWKTDNTPADASFNKGACFTDYSGNIKKEIPQLTGAYLDNTRGTLKIPDISPADYPPIFDLFSKGEYHLYDYQFFFRNLQENVLKRVNVYLAK